MKYIEKNSSPNFQLSVAFCGREKGNDKTNGRKIQKKGRKSKNKKGQQFREFKSHDSFTKF